MKHRIFIVDDHPIVRLGMAELINQQEDLEVCGNSEGGDEMLSSIPTSRPSLLVIDISLNGRDGIELVKNVKRKHPDLSVLIVSMHDETIYAERALRAGASGYVMKQQSPEVLLQAIRCVLNGEIYLSEVMTSRLLSHFSGGQIIGAEHPEQLLTDRELEIFRWIGQGMGTRQIADILCLSVKTVETYRDHIKAKLNLKNSYELVYHAIQYRNKLQH